MWELRYDRAIALDLEDRIVLERRIRARPEHLIVDAATGSPRIYPQMPAGIRMQMLASTPACCHLTVEAGRCSRILVRRIARHRAVTVCVTERKERDGASCSRLMLNVGE